MPRPVTPFVGCDVFCTNEQDEVLLIRRSDNGFWALPGGCLDLGESPIEGAVREAFEESGYNVKITDLLGVYSSQCYDYVNYPWKENEFVHLLFAAQVVGGSPTPSSETLEVAWYAESNIPPLSDGHAPRIVCGFAWKRNPTKPPHFE